MMKKAGIEVEFIRQDGKKEDDNRKIILQFTFTLCQEYKKSEQKIVSWKYVQMVSRCAKCDNWCDHNVKEESVDYHWVLIGKDEDLHLCQACGTLYNEIFPEVSKWLEKGLCSVEVSFMDRKFLIDDILERSG